MEGSSNRQRETEKLLLGDMVEKTKKKKISKNKELITPRLNRRFVVMQTVRGGSFTNCQSIDDCGLQAS